jgi:hypothetical protein
MSIVLCRLPRAGLGNQLFPLMRAFVFGHLHNIPVVVTGYHQFKIGPYLRGEKSKRKYSHYFNFQKSFLGEQWEAWKIRNTHFSERIQEPSLDSSLFKNEKVIYEFSSIPSWKDYFMQLRDHRQTVCVLLHRLINKKIKEELEMLARPWIGVHIRMGDFRKLNEGEDFSKVGTVRTPETYFINTIERIRALYGTPVPVSVFTDGYKHEFEKLFTLPDINMIEGNKDLTDMLLLSRSKVIVTSAGSSFSYWSGFLSNAPIILHADHIAGSIRSPDKDSVLFEGPVEFLHKSYLNSNAI